MNARFFLVTSILVIGISIISACAGVIPVTSDKQATAAAATAEAEATQAAMETQIADLRTQVATRIIGQIATARPAANQSSPSRTPTRVKPSATAVPPTATPLPPTPTATPLPCNSAAFGGDISIPDGSVIGAGTSFTKTWRLRNTGSCAWTTDYALVFTSGEQMSGPDALNLPADVQPGDVIDLSVDLVAPGQAGGYRGDWKLRDAQGVLFGLGRRGDAFFVDIQVNEDSGSPLDFVASYCQAEWSNRSGRIACPSTGNDSRGYVVRINKPILETGYVDDQPALLTQPQMITNGLIRGRYPALRIKPGDHFITVIGCGYKTGDCDVTFQLDYQVDNGPVQNLGAWQEVYDSQFHRIDLDLSDLAGQRVRFILSVYENGAPHKDHAQWLTPRIER